MRQPCLRASIGGVLLLLATPTLARDVFEIPSTFPGTYEELYKVIKKDLDKDNDKDKQKQKEKENISAYLDAAQCGGWNMELSVEGRIADTENLPGHEGDWKGNIPSGMALRNDDLTYPDGAAGLFTACEDSRFESEKTAWRDDAQGRIPITVNYPYFEDPPCLWLDNAPVDGPQTPEKCQEFATWTNGYTYADCRDENIIPVFDDEGNYLFSYCGKWEDRYVCSDEWVEGGRGNSASCTGSECRCDGTQASCVTSPFNGRPYRSFYRRYDANYKRLSVPDAPKDVANKDARFGCYGLYEEFDPKTHQTQEKDKRCIADINLEEMKKTQLGKGKYGQDSNLPDPPAAKRNEGKYDKDKDLWYVLLGQAIDFVNSGLQAEKNYTLTTFLSNLSRGTQKATVQLTTEKPVAKHSYIRAFDETGESRMLTKWWQTQQTRLQTFVHGPVLRLVLPTTWAIGASTDPFLEKAESKEEKSLDDRSKRIEVQIRAGKDTLGEAISFIDRSLTLQVIEEPLPIILPLVDPMELRATAASWCAWASAQKGEANCDGADAKVTELIKDLNAYADAIEDYRALRADISEYSAELLKLQQEVTKPLTDWLKKNIDDYKKSVESRKEIADQIAPILENAQGILATFHDETNLPWCMNQRFTIPIFSLLDPWLPSRANGGEISEEGLPSLPDPGTVPQDIIVDLSKISYMQTSIRATLLQPQQVRLAIPRPPHMDAIEELPDIGKEVQKIRDALKKSREQLPKVRQKGAPPTITLPEPIDPVTIAEMRTGAAGIVTLFTEMKETYDEFWQSMGPLDSDEGEKDGESDGAKSAREDRNKEKQELREKKQKLECDWGVSPCVHVEMDLVERLTRVGSRPLVFLKEDYESTGSGRTLASDCPPEDHVCLLMHPEKSEPLQGWQIRAPEENDNSGNEDDARKTLRSLSFPKPAGSAEKKDIPPYDATLWERIQGIISFPSSPILPTTKK